MTDASTTERAALLPQVIIQAFDLVLDELYRHLVETGHDDLRPTHCLNVFRFMDCDGTRPGVLAARAGMTPQAMGELVSYLERRGYVRRVQDPGDGRGRIVVYAERGTRAAEVAEFFFADLERRWAVVVGAERLDEMVAVLARVLESAARSETESGPSGR
ncbi:MarR family winged helix-turn-helix transcriptional regulator [Glycomyces tenuis]|uniref:MarR family winged helix-turn-helix transcriptional regulator n=1 Tax=Glycomyces tenuis TaxID=58116 RepID=UPI00041F7244|nr:MarR family winged helix-turn-helix transcriptional regulator [Glycomyces tenuis]